MAYNRCCRPKRSYRRKRSYKKKSYSKPSSSLSRMAIAGLGGLALTLLKAKLGLNTETHWLDTTETAVGTLATMTAMAYPLTIPIGDTSNTRTGQSCRLTSYTCNLTISQIAAATIPCQIRVLFVHIKDTRCTSYGASSFMDSNTRITSGYNMGDSDDAVGYKILYDRTFDLSVVGGDDAIRRVFFKYNPLSHHLKWTSADTTGVASNLISGFVRGFIQTTATSNQPTYTCDHRVKFVDN